MFIRTKRIQPIIDQNIIDLIKDNSDIIMFYFSRLIENKCNYLYWTTENVKSKRLLFTNIKNSDKCNFIKPNAPDMVTKLITVHDNQAWEVIKNLLKIFSNTIGIPENRIFNNIYIFQVNSILQILKKTDFDVSQLELKVDMFNSVFSDNENTKRKKLYSYVEPDIVVMLVLKKILRTLTIRMKMKNPDTYKLIAEEPVKTEWIDGKSIISHSIEIDGKPVDLQLIPKIHIISPTLKRLLDTQFDYTNTIKVMYNDIQNNYIYFNNIVAKKDNLSKFTLMSGLFNFKIFKF